MKENMKEKIELFKSESTSNQSTNNDLGFAVIYQEHNRRTWANYWHPLLVGVTLATTGMMAINYPVITTANPSRKFRHTKFK